MRTSKLCCPHCSTEATQFQAYVIISSVVFCTNCGWNLGNATKQLQADKWATLLVSGFGVILASMAWRRWPYGSNDALLIAIPFVFLPLVAGLITMYRLSRVAAARQDVQRGAVSMVAPATAAPTIVDNEEAASLAMRPRRVRLSMKGYLYITGMVLVAAFVSWLLLLVLQASAGLSKAAIVKYVFALLVWCWALWSCASFFRNRIRERHLFKNGELSQGHVLSQDATQYGSQIVYSYRDASGRSFQNRATDFSTKLYEGMPIHVFYNPLDSRKSAALESSLYRVG